MEHYIIDGNEDTVTTIRRADGLNGTATITHLGKDEFGIRRWELSGDPINPVGVFRNRPDEYDVAVKFARWALDQPQYGSRAQVDPDAFCPPKVNVEPSETNASANGAYDAPPPLDEQAMSLSSERISLADEKVRIIRRRLSKAKYMRKWREANPELARQKNREAVAAHRARRKTDERLRELRHETAVLQTGEYKAARAALAAEIDRRVRGKYPQLHEEAPSRTH
jgi:hypothetical protein